MTFGSVWQLPLCDSYVNYSHGVRLTFEDDTELCEGGCRESVTQSSQSYCACPSSPASSQFTAWPWDTDPHRNGRTAQAGQQACIQTLTLPSPIFLPTL